MKGLRIVLACLTSAASLAAGAQLRYGLRIGGDINTSSLGGETTFALGHRSGFSGGHTLEYQLPTNGLAFDASVMYTRTGVRFENDGAAPTRSWESADDFLQIPVHAKYKFWLKSMSKLMGPYLYTGPTLLVRLDSDEAGTPATTRRLQPGWDLGVGFDVVNFIQLQAGYRFGLTNVLHEGSGLPDARMRNDGVTISAAFLFDF